MVLDLRRLDVHLNVQVLGSARVRRAVLITRRQVDRAAATCVQESAAQEPHPRRVRAVGGLEDIQDAHDVEVCDLRRRRSTVAARGQDAQRIVTHAELELQGRLGDIRFLVHSVVAIDAVVDARRGRPVRVVEQRLDGIAVADHHGATNQVVCPRPEGACGGVELANTHLDTLLPWRVRMSTAVVVRSGAVAHPDLDGVVHRALRVHPIAVFVEVVELDVEDEHDTPWPRADVRQLVVAAAFGHRRLDVMLGLWRLRRRMPHHVRCVVVLGFPIEVVHGRFACTDVRGRDSLQLAVLHRRQAQRADTALFDRVPECSQHLRRHGRRRCIGDTHCLEHRVERWFSEVVALGAIA